jgi:hypothetical protein
MITPISAAANYAVTGHVNVVLERFVAWHKGEARPDARGYNRERQPGDVEYPLLHPHQAGESIQDKSLDARLSFCHMPAYK